MTLGVSVKDGSNAGWRIARPPQQKPWTCPVGHVNKPHYLTCFTDGCRHKRGDEAPRRLEKGDYPAVLRNAGE